MSLVKILISGLMVTLVFALSCTTPSSEPTVMPTAEPSALMETPIIELTATPVVLGENPTAIAIPVPTATAATTATTTDTALPSPASTPRPTAADYTGLAIEAIGLDRYDDALALVRSALSVEPEDPDALVLNGWATALIEGDSEFGVMQIERAVSSNPGEPSYRFRLSEVMTAAGLWEDALEQLEFFEQLGGEKYAAVSLRAKIALAKDEPETALAVIMSAIGESISSEARAELSFLEAVAFLSLDEYRSALDSLEREDQEESPYIELAYGSANLGITLSRGDQVTLFDENFVAVEPSAEMIVEALRTLSSTPYIHQKIVWDASLTSLVNGAQELVVDPVIEFTIQLEESDFVEEAADVLLSMQSWVLEDWKSYAYGERANLLSGLGRYDEAESEYSVAIELAPSWFRYAGRAEVSARLNRPAAARDDAERAIALNPEDADLRIRISNVFLAIGEFDSAAEERIAAIRLGRADAPTYVLAIDALGAAGKLEDGISLATEAVTLFTDDGTFLAYRGSFLDATGNGEQAQIDLDRSVEIDPDNPTVYSFRAAFRLRGEDIEGAITDAEFAIDLGIEEPFLQFMQFIIGLGQVAEQ